MPWMVREMPACFPPDEGFAVSDLREPEKRSSGRELAECME